MVVARCGYVVPAPMADVLRRMAVELGGRKPLARRLGVHDRRLSSFLDHTTKDRESGLLKVETADRWLIALGLRVIDVYGELYGLAILENDWRGGVCEWCGEHLREPAALCGFCERR